MMAIADSLAPTDIVPLISKLYAWTMLQCCTSLVFCVTVTVIGRQKPHRAVPSELAFLAFPEVVIQKKFISKFFTYHSNRTSSSLPCSSDCSSKSSAAVSATSDSLSSSASSSAHRSTCSHFVITPKKPLAAYGSPSRRVDCFGRPVDSSIVYWPETWRRESTRNIFIPNRTSQQRQRQTDAENYLMYGDRRNWPFASEWELVARRINTLFLLFFLLLTVVGYAMCLPNINFS